MTHNHNKLAASSILFSMWINWTVAFGAIALLLISSLFLPPKILPFLGFVFFFALTSYLKSDMGMRNGNCTLVIRVAQQTILWSSVIMLVILLLFTPWVINRVYALEIYNDEIPFITSLVVFPVLAASSGLGLLARRNLRHCQECQQRNGFYAGDSIIGTFYYSESRYQMRTLLMLALVISGVEYWYYFFRYINSNLNSPDRFFFVYMPVGIFVLSVMIMFSRYSSMIPVLELFKKRGGEDTTLLRFLIFCGDEMYLSMNKDMHADTPAEKGIPRRRRLSDHEAIHQFRGLTGLEDFDLKYLFTSNGFAGSPNLMIYSVFVSQDVREKTDTYFTRTGGTWYNLYMLDEAMKTGALDPELRNEIYRIHTITMTWKTYDRNGRRLYPIKHYRPTFRLRDLPNWSVDYDDLSWYHIAGNNEDRHFFHLRKFWNRITSLFNTKQRARG